MSTQVILMLLAAVTAVNILLSVLIPVDRLAVIQPTHRSSASFPQEWQISPLDTVALTVEDSVNYQLDTVEGALQWQALIPPGGGIVELGPGSKRYRLSMFHQLECLDTVRRNVLERHVDRITPPSSETRYCLNYLRQMILCRSDTQLEPVRSEYGGKSVQPFVTHSNCRDWTAVYSELEKQRPMD